MATLKDQMNDIGKDTESLVKEYIRLFSIRQSEKLALFLGILSSVFVLATLLLIVVIFSSFALAAYLNKILPGDFWGFWIVGGAYVLLIILLLIRIFKSKTPLFGNFFARMISTVMDLDTADANNLKGLRHAGELANQKIDANKLKIKGDLQLLRFTIFEALFKEFFALFKSGKKEKGADRKTEKAKMKEKSNRTDKAGKAGRTKNIQ